MTSLALNNRAQELNFYKLFFLNSKELIILLQFVNLTCFSYFFFLIYAIFSPFSNFHGQVVNFVWKICYVPLWSSNKILYASSRNVYTRPLKLMKKYTF